MSGPAQSLFPPAVGVLGVGLDLVDVSRLEAALRRRSRLAGRVFTEAEIAYASGHRSPWEHFAVRFAAKEATMKALGVGLGAFALRDVEVIRLAGGAPAIRLHAGAAALAQSRGVLALCCSLTHAGGFAQAMVIAQGSAGGAP